MYGSGGQILQASPPALYSEVVRNSTGGEASNEAKRADTDVKDKITEFDLKTGQAAPKALTNGT